MIEDFFSNVSPELILGRFTSEQRLKGLSLYQRIRGYSDEDIAQCVERRRSQRVSFTSTRQRGAILLAPTHLPYSLEQFERDIVKDALESLDPEEFLEHFTPHQRMQGLTEEYIEQYLQHLRGLRADGRAGG